MRPSDDAIAPDPLGPEPVGSPPAAGGHGSRRERLLTRWQGATLALLAGGLLFGACQGDNIWSGNSESLQPQVVGIAAPATVYPGDTLQVQVSAYGARQITSVSVQLSGAATLDTTVSLQPAATVAANLRIPLSTYLADTMLVIRAVAYDKTGAISRMRSDTTRAIAPPAVVSMSGPDSVRPGSSLSFEVRATGVRPITRIRFALRGAVTRYDSIMVAQPRKDVTDAITFQVAATDLTDTTLVVSAQPVDNSGLDGFITRGTIPVAIPAPVITLLTAPDSVRAGGSLDVSVDARALRNVTRLAFSLRGAVTRDSAVNVAVPAHTVTQSASFIIPPEAQDSLIKLSVSAIDAAGKASIPTVKNISIPTGIPVVDSLVVGDSIRPGTILDARVFAHGSRQLSRIDLSLRGAVNRDINMVPSPPRTNVTADFAVPMPDTMADTLMVVMAKATDAGGSVSAIKQKVIRASDTALPTVTATLSQNSIAAGRNLLVHLIAKDNVGLGSIGLRLLNSANTVLSTVSAAASGRSRDTTLSLPIPIMGPATLSVIAFAVDRGGREGRSTPMPLTVVDSVAPIADIVAPTAGATYPLSDSVRVQVHVGSIVGVKKVRVQGIAIRENCCGPTQIVDRYREYTLSFPQPPAMRLPLDTLLQNCWLKYLPGETTAEMVYLVATVTDSANNVATDTVQVSVGGPFVQILSPTNGGNVGVGQPFQLRLMAKDGTGLDSIRIRLGGAASRSTLLTYPRTIPPPTAYCTWLATRCPRRASSPSMLKPGITTRSSGARRL